MLRPGKEWGARHKLAGKGFTLIVITIPSPLIQSYLVLASPGRGWGLGGGSPAFSLVMIRPAGSCTPRSSSIRQSRYANALAVPSG